MQNLNITLSGDKVVYAPHGDYDQNTGTVTLINNQIVTYTPLVPGNDYVLDSKDLADPVKVKYSGPDHNNGNLIFLVV